MTAALIDSAFIIMTDEQTAELRRRLKAEPASPAALPSDTNALRAALAFYADLSNWQEGVGTGPQRAAPCVADSGQRARDALAGADTRIGYREPALSTDGKQGPGAAVLARKWTRALSGQIWRGCDDQLAQAGSESDTERRRQLVPVRRI